MIEKSLSNRDLFKIYDPNDAKTYYGCSQDWYDTEWQRRAGCGPVTASNIFLYMVHKQNLIEPGQGLVNRDRVLQLMNEVWQYVTPTNRGIPTTKMFFDYIVSYIKAKQLNFSCKSIDIPEDANMRPNFRELLDFIEQAFVNDAPIAFLNLCNGEEKSLDRWHWVTVISLEYAEDGSSSFINILDEGLIKRINLSLWYNTTMLGGGFVYLSDRQQHVL